MPLFPGNLCKNYKMMIGSLSSKTVGSCRDQSITHTQQTSISREYYYETFKPPLSSRISMRSLSKSQEKEEIPTTPTEQSLCGVFSFATFGFGCLVVACLSHFSVWSRAPRQSGTMHCEDTHIFFIFCYSQDLSKVQNNLSVRYRRIMKPSFFTFPSDLSFSFEELADVQKYTDTQRLSVVSSWFFFSLPIQTDTQHSG